MSLNVLFSRLSVFDNEFQIYEGIEELFINLKNNGHDIVVMTHNKKHYETIKDLLKNKFDFEISTVRRSSIKDINDEELIKKIVLVGSSNQDLYQATNKKMLLINPGWSVIQDDKPQRYGITLNNTDQLFESIKLLDNQSRCILN